MLTQKQEKFCQNVVSGMDNISAYMNAYDCNSKGAANVESTKLMKRDDITERIQELNKPIVNLIQNSVISERKQQINYIKERIAICEKSHDEQSIIRYTDMLNKMYNLYKDNETEQKQDSSVNDLDIDILKKLSGAS